MDGLKGGTEIKNIASQFKFDIRFYNIQRSDDVKHRGINCDGTTNFFLSLNVINVNISLYRIKGVLRHYHYRADPKLV